MKRIIIVLAILGAILLSSSLYTVNETQVAIKLRLGEIVSVENSPGLKFKTPFVNNVVSFDKRIQRLLTHMLNGELLILRSSIFRRVVLWHQLT